MPVFKEFPCPASSTEPIRLIYICFGLTNSLPSVITTLPHASRKKNLQKSCYRCAGYQPLPNLSPKGLGDGLVPRASSRPMRAPSAPSIRPFSSSPQPRNLLHLFNISVYDPRVSVALVEWAVIGRTSPHLRRCQIEAPRP